MVLISSLESPIVLLLGHLYMLCFGKDCKAKGNWHSAFPGGPGVRNLPASAGDTGLIPGPGGSRMLPSNRAHEPQLLKSMLLEPMLQSKRNHHRGSPCTTTKRNSHSLQLENVHAQQKRPSAAYR